MTSAIHAEFGRTSTVVTPAINDRVGVLCRAIDCLTEKFLLGFLVAVRHGSSSHAPSGTPGAVHRLSLVIRNRHY